MLYCQQVCCLSCSGRTLQTCIWYGGWDVACDDKNEAKAKAEAVVSTHRTSKLCSSSEPHNRSPVRRRAATSAHLYLSPAWRHRRAWWRWSQCVNQVDIALPATVRRFHIKTKASTVLRLDKEEEKVAKDWRVDDGVVGQRTVHQRRERRANFLMSMRS